MVAAARIDGTLGHMTDFLIGRVNAKLTHTHRHADGLTEHLPCLDATQAGTLGIRIIVDDAKDLDAKLGETLRTNVNDITRPA